MNASNVAPVASQETASLVKRLAGPSTGKAGLAKDQTEINRIIADASKGSKFYENEKRKDKDVTERIRKILHQRDDALIGVDIKTIEKLADHLLAELEYQRDLSQTIVHIDMDAFFANVEILHNPDLEGKPFGVGRGVLTTASYEARKYGVRSGMPGFIAQKLCPELIFVSNHFSRYTEMSDSVMTVLRNYDSNMLVASCDEGYLNITAYCQRHNITAGECVLEMREAVYKQTKLTASAGIAPNKMLAKICSDKNKPNGQYQLPSDRNSIVCFMRDLSIRKIPGIGRVNERLLESIGIKTCGDIFTHRATISLMDKQFSRQFLFRTYLGISSNVVQPSERSGRKSIGAERTFSPTADKARILQKLDDISTELERGMQKNGWIGRTVTLKYKLDTYQVFTRSHSFDRWIKKKEDLYLTGKELLLPDFPLSIRLIGLRVTKLKDLKAPSPSNGIKRFFEPLQHGRSTKRAKLRDEPEDDGFDPTDAVQDDEPDDMIPGFHEHYEEDSDLGQIQHDDDLALRATLNGVPIKPRQPAALAIGVSGLEVMQDITSGLSSSVSRPTVKTGKPHSSGHRPSEALPSSTDWITQDCPVCGKTLQTDNNGVNSHIDFCLSRGAIRQAHAEANTPVKKVVLAALKPISKGRREREANPPLRL